MNQYSINRIDHEVSNPQQSLKTLIRQICERYNTEQNVVSSIIVNGIELSDQEQDLIGHIPLSQFRSLEIFTAHPREIAEETLQSLVEFTTHLETLCKQVAQEPEKLPALADGITTFIDALTNVKRILKIGILPSVQVLEVDLASILRDILEFQERKEFGSVASMIQDALVQNLTLWRTEGIPKVIRSRDS